MSRPARTLAFMAGLTAWAGCKESTGPQRNPAPVLLSLNPILHLVGTTTPSVSITGEGFLASSRGQLNGQDRPTSYIDEAHLTMQLLPEDLDTIADFTVNVVNPAPGGGTSLGRPLGVRFGTPFILSIEPDTILTLSPTTEFVITGTGFHPTSTVDGVHFSLGTTYVSPTELRWSAAANGLVEPYIISVRVTNPGAAGSWSPIAILNPRPQFDPMAADSLFRGAGRQLLNVTGSGFRRESVVRIDGQPRETEYVSATALRVALVPTDARFLDTLDVDIRSPEPSLGTSAVRAIRIVRAPPTISGMTPSTVLAGTPDALVSIRGTDFAPDAVVDLDGAEVPTSFIDSTHVQVTLPAAALGAPATRLLRVRNPARGNATPTLGLPVLPPSPTLDAPFSVEIPTRHMVGNADGSRLYATVAAAHATLGDHVIRLDPATGTVTASLAIAGGGGRLAVTDDESMLYVARVDSHTVARIRLSDFTRLPDLVLSATDVNQVLRAGDVTTIPGRPELVAVDIRNPSNSSSAGTFLFSGETRLPRSQDVSRVAAASGTELYGYADSGTPIHRLAIVGDGLHLLDLFGSGLSAISELHLGGSLIFGSNGIVIDPFARLSINALPVGGTMAVDEVAGRVHVLAGSTLHSFALISQEQIGSAAVAGTVSAHTLVRWGTNGLAVGTSTRIVFLTGSLIAP